MALGYGAVYAGKKVVLRVVGEKRKLSV